METIINTNTIETETITVAETPVAPKAKKVRATRTKKAASAAPVVEAPVVAEVFVKVVDGHIVATLADGSPVHISVDGAMAVMDKAAVAAKFNGLKVQVSTLTAQLEHANARLAKAEAWWAANHTKAQPVQSQGKTYTRTQQPGKLYCSCGNTMTEKVRDFSIKEFGEAMCFTCQRKTRTARHQAEQITSTEGQGAVC